MRMFDVIEKKRDKKELSSEEIKFFVDGYTKGDIPDYQVSALLMASFLNGLTIKETTDLCYAMLNSGEVLNLSDIPGVKVDKHSTGGVGDKTSLIIVPICAAVGVIVPMISGRGLGHTGGTLDKLESIPGFNVNIDLKAFRKILRECGTCMIGQTGQIAPADKKIYSLRDVTATVESKYLIAASVMSKKLAEGIDHLVLDVKVGKGAFMKSMEDACSLANILVSLGENMNKRVVALITDMQQPLGSYVGNALEVIESIQILQNRCLPEQEDLKELSLILSGYMIYLGGKASSMEEGKVIAEKTLMDLSAFNKFKEFVSLQGGDAAALDDISKLPAAMYSREITAPKGGYIAEVNALDIGKGSMILGAGRETVKDNVDHAVGVIIRKKIGDKVSPGDTLLEIKYNDEERLKIAYPLFEKALHIVDNYVNKVPIIKKIIGG